MAADEEQDDEAGTEAAMTAPKTKPLTDRQHAILLAAKALRERGEFSHANLCRALGLKQSGTYVAHTLDVLKLRGWL